MTRTSCIETKSKRTISSNSRKFRKKEDRGFKLETDNNIANGSVLNSVSNPFPRLNAISAYL